MSLIWLGGLGTPYNFSSIIPLR